MMRLKLAFLENVDRFFETTSYDIVSYDIIHLSSDM